MANHSHNNKRIAKNTVVLYIRMLVVMGVTLFTSRIVLQALGVEDFGLYNVVGGVVGLFAFLRTSMEKCTQRFLNVEMAKPDGRINDTFCVSVTIHILIMLLILLLAETIGLWFLNAKINIPEGREIAANWIYQSSVLSLCLTLLSVPYSATIIAHEKMGFFAVVSIADAFLKLGFAYLILVSSFDHLIFYGYLMASVSLINFILYMSYCRIKFAETKFRFLFDKDLFKNMFGFVSWTLLGQMAILGTNQGNSILVNMFHSVTANAAMSVGAQVNSAVTSLSSSFQTAFTPQITKSYASNDYEYLKFLVFTTSKISFFLLTMVSIPLAFNIDFVLSVWLKTVPAYSGIFCILTLCNGILNALSAPLNFTVMATGKIKWFQIVTSIVYLSDLVIVYALFSMGFPPATALVVKVSIMVLVLFVRLHYAHVNVPCIDLISYTKSIILPLTLSTALSICTAYLIMEWADSVLAQILATCGIIVSTFLFMFFIGLSARERQSLNNTIRKVLKRN